MKANNYDAAAKEESTECDNTKQEKWNERTEGEKKNIRQPPRPLTAVSNYEELKQMIISTCHFFLYTSF